MSTSEDTYVTIRLTQPVQTLHLERPLKCGEHMELALVDFEAPRSYVNITHSDIIKIAKYDLVKRFTLAEKSDYEAINGLFASNNIDVHLLHTQRRFIISVAANLIVELSKTLAYKLRLPRQIRGTRRGALRGNGKISLSGEIVVYAYPPTKHLFRIPPALYTTREQLCKTFRKYGLKELGDDGEIKLSGIDTVHMSQELEEKLKSPPSYDVLFLTSDLLANELVGGGSLPLLRIVTSNKNFKIGKALAYKSIQRSGELSTITIALCDENRRAATFLGAITLTLHIRNNAKNSLL